MNVSSTPPSGSAPPPVPPGLPRPSIVLCRKCGRPNDPNFAFCPHCGQRQRQGDAWYYDPVWIAIMALLVLGPFALGLVWRSGRMSRSLKFVYTAVILVYAVFTFYYFYRVLSYELSVFSEFNQLL